MIARAWGLAALFVLLSQSGVAAAPLSGKALRDTVSGRSIYLKVPLGGEFPLHYASDGTVSGESPRSLFVNLTPKTDNGRWWIDGEKLCQQWRIWYDRKRYCFTLSKTGDTSLSWLRDDGLSGTARINP